MRVKIGDQIFDSNEQPIAIIFTTWEKHLICNMGSQERFCVYPEGMKKDKIEEFLKDVELPKMLFGRGNDKSTSSEDIEKLMKVGEKNG